MYQTGPSDWSEVATIQFYQSCWYRSSSGYSEQEVAKKSKIEEFIDLELHRVMLVIITWDISGFEVKSLYKFQFYSSEFCLT